MTTNTHGAMPELPVVGALWEFVGRDPLRDQTKPCARALHEMNPDNPPYPETWQPVDKLVRLSDARAAVEQAVAVPEGHRIVPVEPTPAMLEASLRVFEWGWVEPCPELLECGVPVEMGITQEEADHINAENMKEQAKIYRAMLAAAPPLPSRDSVNLAACEKLPEPSKVSVQ